MLIEWFDDRNGMESPATEWAMSTMASDIPFPFDHFFFCFLPADAAAGAYEGLAIDSYLAKF